MGLVEIESTVTFSFARACRIENLGRLAEILRPISGYVAKLRLDCGEGTTLRVAVPVGKWQAISDVAAAIKDLLDSQRRVPVLNSNGDQIGTASGVPVT